VWSLAGLTLSLAMLLLAWHRSRRAGGYYDAQVYGMTARTHRAFAFVASAFAAYFAAALVLRNEAAGIVGMGLYAVVAIFYGTSFLRGASEDE
jgi:hypothetical protein